MRHNTHILYLYIQRERGRRECAIFYIFIYRERKVEENASYDSYLIYIEREREKERKRERQREIRERVISISDFWFLWAVGFSVQYIKKQGHYLPTETTNSDTATKGHGMNRNSTQIIIMGGLQQAYSRPNVQPSIFIDL